MKKKNIIRIIILLCIILLQVTLSYAADSQPKAKWYRYYDHKGIANISTSVTPNHIRFGYEALDQNMQVISRSRPYNAETDIQSAPKRAAQARQNEEDLKLKRAYNNSQTAIQKRDNALAYLKKQIGFQQGQLKQLQNDRITFKRQEMEYRRKGENLPITLKNTLDYNEKNIQDKKNNIQVLQSNYRNTQTQYDNIITRLKTME